MRSGGIPRMLMASCLVFSETAIRPSARLRTCSAKAWSARTFAGSVKFGHQEAGEIVDGCGEAVLSRSEAYLIRPVKDIRSAQNRVEHCRAPDVHAVQQGQSWQGRSFGKGGGFVFQAAEVLQVRERRGFPHRVARASADAAPSSRCTP